MIDKKFIEDAVSRAIEGTDIFIVDIEQDADNNIRVEIDSPELLDLDTVADISRRVNEAIEAEDAAFDYSLELGSAGLTSHLRVRGQYVKHIGKPVEVLTADGRKLRGIITAVSEADAPLSFTLEMQTKVKEPGAKRPTVKTVAETFTADMVKSVVPEFQFK